MNQEDGNYFRTDRQRDNSSSQELKIIYEDELETNRDIYDDSVLCLSLNVNGLKHEHWKAKNDRLRQFLKKYEFKEIYWSICTCLTQLPPFITKLNDFFKSAFLNKKYLMFFIFNIL